MGSWGLQAPRQAFLGCIPCLGLGQALVRAAQVPEPLEGSTTVTLQSSTKEDALYPGEESSQHWRTPFPAYLPINVLS